MWSVYEYGVPMFSWAELVNANVCVRDDGLEICCEYWHLELKTKSLSQHHENFSHKSSST